MLNTIVDFQEDIVKFTQEIIKIQSFTGEEKELADCVLQKLLEFEVDEAFIDGIGNVIGLIRGDEAGTDVMLNSHLDIVPAGNIDNWHGFDPFGGAIDNNSNIRGRGAADLKGGLSVQLYTMKLLGDSSVTVTNLVCKPGGLSIIPDECEISIDRRYMPEQNIEDLLKEFETLFTELKKEDPEFDAIVCSRKILERSYTGYEKEVQKYHPPWIVDEADPLVKRSLKALRSIGQNPQINYWKFGTDGSMTAGLLSIPTIGYSGTEEDYAHTPEERVNIEMMMQSLNGYYAIITELLEIEIE